MVDPPLETRFRHSLRLRLFLGMLAVALVATVGFGVAMYEFVEVLEEELLHHTLVRQLDALVVDYRDDADVAGERGIDDWVYVVGPGVESGAVPAALLGIGPGRYRIIQRDGREYYAGRRDVDGARIYLMLSVEAVEKLERRLGTVGWLTFAAAVIVALLIALLCARLILNPVHSLAARVANLRPGQASAPLAADYSDAAIRAIAGSFDQMVDRFRAFLEREQAFTHDASHELRTPLAVMLSTTELLLSDADTSARTRDRATAIYTAGQRMQRLITALLFLARETPGRRDDCDVVAVLQEVLSNYRAQLQHKHIALEVDAEPCRAPAPAGLVDCLLHNLIENAVEHTDDGHIAVCVDSRRIRVTDTGSGISADTLHNIAARRYHTRHNRGIGIGLYLVQRICIRLGWRLEMDSRPGAGSCFEIHMTPGNDRGGCAAMKAGQR